MKRYSDTTHRSGSISPQGQGGVNPLYLLGAAGLVAFMVFSGDGEGGFNLKTFQRDFATDRLSDLQHQIQVDKDTKAFEESAQRALVLAENYECVTIVNTDDNQLGLDAGAVHVAITPGMVITDPVTGAPLARDTCIRDHLGNFALLMDGGVVGVIAHNPNLALQGANEFTRETSKSVGDAQ